VSSHEIKLPNSTGISSSKNIQKEVVADKTIKNKETPLKKLRTWYLTAQKLDKSAEYIQRIAKIGSEFKSGTELTEKVVLAINNNFKGLHSINQITEITQKMGMYSVFLKIMEKL
jgi:hypothetical protein